MLRAIRRSSFMGKRSLHKPSILRGCGNACKQKYQNERLESGHWQ